MWRFHPPPSFIHILPIFLLLFRIVRQLSDAFHLQQCVSSGAHSSQQNDRSCPNTWDLRFQ